MACVITPLRLSRLGFVLALAFATFRFAFVVPLPCFVAALGLLELLQLLLQRLEPLLKLLIAVADQLVERPESWWPSPRWPVS